MFATNIPRYEKTRIAMQLKKDNTVKRKDRCAIGFTAFAPATERIVPTMLAPMPIQQRSFSASRSGLPNNSATPAPTSDRKKERSTTTAKARATRDTTKPTMSTAFLAVGCL